MDYSKIALEKHEQWRGKLSIESKTRITNKEELSIAYTPGVAAPCLEIQKDEELAYRYTGKGNLVAVITDGSAVLGLGDIEPFRSSIPSGAYGMAGTGCSKSIVRTIQAYSNRTIRYHRHITDMPRHRSRY